MPDPEQLTVRGWEVLRLTSETLVADVVPALGGTVVSVRRRADDLQLLWQTPWGLRHRGALSLPGSAEATMVDTFPGGWHPVFPNGGDSASAHGAEWGFDGEARLTWLDWTQQDGSSPDSSLVLSGRLIRSPFELVRTVRLSDAALSVADTVTNVGAEHVDVMWGQQVAFGGELLGPDTVVDAAATTVRPDVRLSSSSSYDDLLPWPRAYGPQGLVNLRSVGAEGSPESRLAYLSDFATGSVSVRRPSRDLKVELTWDELTWPYAWYALETGARKGFPWFGTARYLAVTPCSSWPAHGLHDARRVSSTTLRILPGRSRTAALTLSVSAAGGRQPRGATG